jgi:hypothetical protein
VFPPNAQFACQQDESGCCDPYDWIISWSGYLTTTAVSGIEPASDPFPDLGLSVEPNPVHGTSILRFELTRDEAVSLTLFDVSGRLVRTIWNGPLPPASYALRWNGTGDAGDPVGAGQYFVRLATEHYVKSSRLTKLD